MGPGRSGFGACTVKAWMRARETRGWWTWNVSVWGLEKSGFGALKVRKVRVWGSKSQMCGAWKVRVWGLYREGLNEGARHERVVGCERRRCGGGVRFARLHRG